MIYVHRICDVRINVINQIKVFQQRTYKIMNIENVKKKLFPLNTVNTAIFKDMRQITMIGHILKCQFSPIQNLG